jgi:hypothetical protein
MERSGGHLGLRDWLIYKNTPFVAARKFETIMQDNRHVQALYDDDLTTQAARMVEYPSDYHLRIQFMLALRPEVLGHTHSLSAEQSTACTDLLCL